LAGTEDGIDDRAGRFGAELAKLRQARGMSQRALARAVTADHTLISRIERGERRLHPDLAKQIDEVLGSGTLLQDLLEVTREAAAELAVRALEAGQRRGPGPVQASGLPPELGIHLAREAEARWLTTALTAFAPAPAVVVVHGIAGVGKTVLATQTAHRLGQTFTDGCLFVDLRGFTDGVPPLSPGDALGRLLTRLGVPAGRLPDAPDERSELFRDLTRGMSLLVVLDNAASAGQVRPLLAEGPGCRTLVTSRSRLPALDGVPSRLSLAPLDDASAAALFRALVGIPESPNRPSSSAPPPGPSRFPALASGEDQDAGAEDAVAAVVGHCGGLPLALRIAAARCTRSSHPEQDIAVLAKRLARAHRLLPELDDGERSVAAALAISLRDLPDARREMFTLLGLCPDEPFDAFTAAALSGLDTDSSGLMLERLHDEALLERVAAESYRFHDLVGAHARDLARTRLSPELVRRALGMLLDSAVADCDRADALLNPQRHRFGEPQLPPGRPAREFSDAARALRWLIEARPALCTLVRQAYDHHFDEQCWRLAYALRGLFFLTRDTAAWEATHRQALAAAARSGDMAAEATTLSNLSLALSAQGHLAEAEAFLQRAIELGRSLPGRHVEMTARGHRAWLLHQRGQHDEAIHEEAAVLDFHRAGGNDRNAAIALRDMAAIEVHIGRTDDAEQHLDEALETFANLGLMLDSTMALNCLAESAVQSGDLKEATTRYLRALEAARSCGSAFERARAHHGLGTLAARTGHRSRARWHLALAQREFGLLHAHNEWQQVSEALASVTTRAPSPAEALPELPTGPHCAGTPGS
jgi:tetratricopeptide (TPR) repeat protein/transcriptional regulator with XRE-family HTH domain